MRLDRQKLVSAVLRAQEDHKTIPSCHLLRHETANVRPVCHTTNVYSCVEGNLLVGFAILAIQLISLKQTQAFPSFKILVFEENKAVTHLCCMHSQCCMRHAVIDIHVIRTLSPGTKTNSVESILF